ncbi:MAG TPA: hypothetical protein ENK57_14995 [Polyangiaceae bacterium]|nr:hypothetical protein [Polyangiaceae bacterium]
MGLSAGILAVAIGACSAGNFGGGPTSSGTGGDGGIDPGEDAGIDVEVGMGGSDDTSFNYTELCGEGCLPETGEPSTPMCTPDPPGTGGGGGTSDGGGEPAVYDCQLTFNGGDVEGVCTETGTIAAGDSCLESSDCAPGHACVADNSCRPYCCGDVEACPAETYCALRDPVAADVPNGVNAASPIPVCVDATNCTLLDPSSCPEGQTCTIVRVDGTTSCVVPGAGLAGDPCKCAADHVCNTKKNECFKLCKLGDADDCPPTHICQAGGAIYPQDFGICVSQ